MRARRLLALVGLLGVLGFCGGCGAPSLKAVKRQAFEKQIDFRQLENAVPSEAALEVSAGRSVSCALLATGEIECWGNPYFMQERSLPGRYKAFDVLGDGICAVDVDGAVACWEVQTSDWGSYCDPYRSYAPCFSLEDVETPKGVFEDVAVLYDDAACGIRPSGWIECWGCSDAQRGTCRPPEGEFLAVDGHISFACGLRTDGAVLCWGNDHALGLGPRRPVIQGDFVDFAAADAGTGCGYLYAITSSNEALSTSWSGEYPFRPSGTTMDTLMTPPPHAFTQIAIEDSHACGVTADGGVVCWGGSRYGECNAPPAEFTSVSVGFHRSCGVTKAGDVVCWGMDYNCFADGAEAYCPGAEESSAGSVTEEG